MILSILDLRASLSTVAVKIYNTDDEKYWKPETIAFNGETLFHNGLKRKIELFSFT